MAERGRTASAPMWGPQRGSLQGGELARALARMDIKEELKGDTFVDGSQTAVRGYPTGHFGKNLPNPEKVHGVSDQYLVLDSWRKNPTASDPAAGRFAWDLMIQGTTHDRFTGVPGLMGNVISMQLTRFDFPLLPEVPYVLGLAPVGGYTLVQNNTSAAGLPPLLVPTTQYPPSALPPAGTYALPWPANPYSQTPQGKVTLQLVETGKQAYSDGPAAYHHCEFSVEAKTVYGNPTQFVAVPLHGDHEETFHFTTPLVDLPSVTLVFRGPDSPLRFLPDVLEGAVLGLDVSGAPGPYVTFTYPGHSLRAGDRFYVSGASTGLPALDSYLNRAEGHVAGGAPGAPLAPGTAIPGDVFYTDPAVGTSGLAPAVGRRADVRVACRRLRIPVRVRTVVEGLTNYMRPTAA